MQSAPPWLRMLDIFKSFTKKHGDATLRFLLLWRLLSYNRAMSSTLPEAFQEQLNAERMKVDVALHNFSVRELVRMMAEKELNVAPAYQRQFRWDNEACSTFIESLFLGLPVPPIFVATNVDYEWEVVDGLQRLSSLTYFTAEDDETAQRVNREHPLTLTGLEKLSQLNGIVYENLPQSLKIYFGRQPLQIVALTDKSDLEVRFDVFERLNKGGITLSAQEVRACVYRGKFNDFIEDLANNQEFSDLLKLQKKAQSDGTKVEEVLKFFAYKNYSDSFDGKVERWLNRYMSVAESKFDSTAERRSFERAVSRLHEVCQGTAFLHGNSKVTPLVQFEACLVGIAELHAQGIEVITPQFDWLNDAELKASSGAGSNSRSMLARRMTRAKEIFRGES